MCEVELNSLFVCPFPCLVYLQGLKECLTMTTTIIKLKKKANNILLSDNIEIGSKHQCVIQTRKGLHRVRHVVS